MKKLTFICLTLAVLTAIASCQKEEIKPAEKPIVNIEECDTVSAEGQSVILKATVTNPVENGIADTKAQPDCDWIENVSLTEDALTFYVTEYETSEENPEDRSAVITVEYPGAEIVQVEVIQSAPAQEKPEEPEPPVVTITWNNDTVIPAEGGEYQATYTIDNPIEGAVPEAVPAEDWITVTSVADGIISFSVAENGAEPGSEPRSGSIAVSYPETEGIPAITFTQEAPEKQTLTFEIDVKEVTSSSVTFDINVSDENATYYRSVMEKSEFDAFENDMAIIQADIDYFLEESWYGPGTIEENLYTGSESDCYEYLYNADTDYYIYAYGLNADGTVTTDGITKVLVHTTPKPVLTVEWDNSTVIPVEGGSYEVPFTITNPIEGETLTANATYACTDWVTDVSVDEEKGVIKFTVLPSTDVTPSYYETRTGGITFYYPDLAYTPTIIFYQTLPTY